VKPKTEEFLNFLLYSATQLTQSPYRNIYGSYESWAYRQGLLRQTAKLEARKFIERSPSAPKDRLYRLTPEGRTHAFGGRDPQAQWARPWDGIWRVVLFDIPTAREAFRLQLRRYFFDHGFGCLQGSVWVTPDPTAPELKKMGDAEIHVTSLIVLEGRPCAGESDAQIVAGAWDFNQINHRYKQYLNVLSVRPEGSLHGESAATQMRDWAAAERKAWLLAMKSDPLLPEALLPPHYMGKESLRQKLQALGKAAHQLGTFHL